MLADVELEGYKKHPHATAVEASVEADHSRLQRSSLSQKKPHLVHMTSATVSRSHGSLDELPEDDGRNDSQERLHYPSGIYKRMEITRTSEAVRQ